MPSSTASPHRHGARGRWWKRGVLGGLALGTVVALAYAWWPKPTRVDVATAAYGPLDVEVSEDGKTRARERIVVFAPVTGDLRRITLDAGARVRAGDVVALIDSPPSPLLDPVTRQQALASIAAARARAQTAATAVDRAREASASARRDAERARRLEAGGATPRVDREHAELAAQLAERDVASAERQRAAAEAEVQAARAVIDAPRTALLPPVPVTAPAASTVLTVVRESAGPITAGQPLLELGDPADLEVVIDVLSSDAAAVREGMPVVLEGWGGDTFTARVTRIEPSAFTQISSLGIEEQRVRVIAALSPAPAGIGDGYRVDARILVWHADRVLRVPVTALVRDGERWAVYVARDGRARLRDVEVGHRGRDHVEVTSGLVEGEPVILHPGDAIAPGVRVASRARGSTR